MSACKSSSANGAEHQVDTSLAQFAEFRHSGNCLIDVKLQARVALQQPIDDDGKQSRRNPFGASDAKFAHGRVCQELDFLHALPQRIVSSKPMFEEGTAV